MGDGVEWQLNSVGILPLSFKDDEVRSPFGFRVNPVLGLRIHGWFLQAGGEIGLSRFDASPLGVNHFDTDPTFYYTVNTGYQFNPDWTFRIGRYHYEQTDIEGLMTNNAYQVAPTFANVTVPLGWLGASLRYDRVRDSGALRRGTLSAAFQRGDDETHLGVFQGLVSFALGESATPPELTLAGNYTVREGAAPDSGDFEGTGLTHGFAFALQLHWRMLELGFAVNHSSGHFTQPTGKEFSEERQSFASQISLLPGDWVIRAGHTFVNLAQSTDPGFLPPLAFTENHFELSAGYQPVEGLLISAGYRGAWGEPNYQANMIFLGLQTGFSGIFEFGGREASAE